MLALAAAQEGLLMTYRLVLYHAITWQERVANIEVLRTDDNGNRIMTTIHRMKSNWVSCYILRHGSVQENNNNRRKARLSKERNRNVR